MKFKSKILVIAGSDSSGGAGIQADIKTITSLGSYAMTAITAITSQNTTGVLSISKVPINEIKRQIEFTSKDIRPDAIKIGMSPMPQYDFPGLLPGQKWCLCANRWLEAYNSGMAPPIIAESTNIKTLEIIDIDLINQYTLN